MAAPVPAWPAERVVLRPIVDLVPRASNSRTHSAAQIDQLCALMLEHGWTTAVLVDEEDVLIAGHGRVLAAAQLLARGHDRFAQAPVTTATGWTDAQKRAYVIADNQVATLAGWNEKLLGSELRELEGLGVDMGLIGFGQADLRRLMRGSGGGLTNPDEAPEAPESPVSRLGDMWVLGDHVIRCGSSTSPDDVAALLDGREPQLMVTDPTYGVEYDPNWRSKATGQKVRATGLVLNDDRADWREAWALFPGAVAYVWHGALHAGTVQASLEAEGFEMRSQIIWVKDRFALSRGHYHWRHEPAWYAVRKGRKADWRGGRKRDTVWRVDGLPDDRAAEVVAILEEHGAEPTVWEIPMTVDDGSTGHGTQKPVECMRRPMEANSAEGDWVYEPFSGSGSSIIAGEQSGRRVLAMELSPAYVDVAVRRWEAFTGALAVHASLGLSFAQVSAQRGPERETL